MGSPPPLPLPISKYMARSQAMERPDSTYADMSVAEEKLSFTRTVRRDEGSGSTSRVPRSPPGVI